MSDPTLDYAVFLAHNSRDKDLVELIAHKLRNAGLRPWFDKWELRPGERWINRLAEGVSASQSCAVFIGPNNLGNWEAEELALAQIRASEDKTFHLIPVLLPGLPDPFDSSSLPPFLRSQVWADFRRSIDDPHAFHCLQCGVQRIAPGPDLTSISTNDVDLQTQQIWPYRGLQVFNEEDAEYYFGRTGDIQRLVEKLKVARFLGVLGASGSGKSSLVRAGLIPSLRDGCLPGSESWKIIEPFTPGPAPLETLVWHLGKATGMDTGQLLRFLYDSECALHIVVRDFLDSIAARNQATQRVVLVIDQLEELFTLCPPEKERDRSQFLANLLYATSAPNGSCFVVLTMRADFYPKCAAYPQFSEMLSSHQFLISAMSRDGLVQAIREPARNKNVRLTFEPGLVSIIADDVANQPGTLPLLQHALLELWKRRKNGQLTLEGYMDAGRVQGAIAQRADAIYDSFSVEEQIVMRGIMLRLTQPGEGTEDTRRPASVDELVTKTRNRESVEKVIATLVTPENRLITISEKDGARIIDVSNEALIRGWDKLKGWLDEDREGRRLHRRITEAANEWQESIRLDSNAENDGLAGLKPGINVGNGIINSALLWARALEWRKEHELGPKEKKRKERAKSSNGDQGFLYGLALERALEWRERHEMDLNDVERQFLDECEAQMLRMEERDREREQFELEMAQRLTTAAHVQADLERRARMKQQFLIVVLVVLIITTSTLAVYYNQVSKISRSAELTTEAKRVLIENPRRSVKLATEAMELNPTLIAENVLRDSLLAFSGSQGERSIPSVTINRVSSAAFSPDGNYIVTARSDGTVAVFDAHTGKLEQTLSGNTNAVTSTAFSPNGEWIVGTTEFDNTVWIWDTVTRTLRQRLKTHTAGITTAVFDADSTRLVTASLDGTIIIWNVALWTLERQIGGWGISVDNATFNSEGDEVLGVGHDGTVRVWDVRTGEFLRELTRKIRSSAVFSADGKWIVTTDTEHDPILWERKKSQEGYLFEEIFLIQALHGHLVGFKAISFAPNDRWIVTAGIDETVRIWDIQGGMKLIFKSLTDDITRVVFSPNSERVMTISRDGIARVFNCEEFGSNKTLLELSRSSVPEQLTDAERESSR
jgi:WD40 repeat protein